jgi:hypothetical protein
MDVDSGTILSTVKDMECIGTLAVEERRNGGEDADDDV